MPFMGTIINVAAIILGSFVGLTIGRKIPEKTRDALIKIIGLFTIAIGVKMFLESEAIVGLVLSLVIGGIIGEFINIEGALEIFGLKIKSTIKTNDQRFLDGFVMASLVYCIGPMAILGSITDGIGGGYEILLVKSVMDGSVSIGFAASLGMGVLFSSVPVLIYQGAITLVAIFAGHFLSDPMIHELTAIGGVLIMGIGVNVLGAVNKRIPVANFLPAIVVILLFVWLSEHFGIML